MRNAKENTFLADGNIPDPIFRMTVKLDSLHLSVSTRHFGTVEAFSLLVGLERVVRLFFVVASILFIHPIFMREVLSDLYLVKKPNQHQKILEDKTPMSFSTNNFMMNFIAQANVDASKQNKTAKFVNSKEKKNYETMMNNIKEKGEIKISDTLHIIGNIWSARTSFKQLISWRQMLFHGQIGRKIRSLLCNSKKVRIDRLVENAENRYYKELDIVNVLNTIRLFKIFFTRKFPSH